MQNDRPIDDPNLQAGLNEIKRIMHRRKLAGAAMLVSSEEAAFTYGMHAPWSALRADAATPLGFRFRVKSAEDGADLTHKRVEAAMHTICQLADFGAQTQDWMEQLKAMLRQAVAIAGHQPGIVGGTSI